MYKLRKQNVSRTVETEKEVKYWVGEGYTLVETQNETASSGENTEETVTEVKVKNTTTTKK